MTEAIAFDSHRFVKNLTAGGFTEQQAEVLADEQVQLLNANLATKADLHAVNADLQAVEAGLKANLHAVEAGLKADLHAVKADLLKWMMAAMTAQTGLIAGLIVGLLRFF